MDDGGSLARSPRRFMQAFAGLESERRATMWILTERFRLRNIIGLLRYAILVARYPRLRRAGLFYTARGSDFVVGPAADVVFGRGLSFMRDCNCTFSGRVRIGTHVFFNRGCHLVVHESVTIGDGCLFGEMVTIHDDDHAYTATSEMLPHRGLTTAPIVIGDNVWVGAKATITKGVKIGSNCVIGANAVVTHDIPAGCVAVGAPARVVRQL